MLIVSLLTLVHLVAASSSLRIAHPIKALNTRDLVVARQTSTSTNGTVPAQCETDCDPIEAALAQIQVSHLFVEECTLLTGRRTNVRQKTAVNRISSPDMQFASSVLVTL